MKTATSVGVSPADLRYPFPDAPATGATTAVAPGVHWLRMPLPLALNHINLWMLADGDGWTLVDTGYATDAARVAWSSILQDAVPRRLIVTHCHPDHIGLAGWLADKYGLTPWMTEAEFLLAHMVYHRVGGTGLAELLAFNERHGLDAARLAAIHTREDHYRRGVAGLPQSLRRMHDDEAIVIGDQTWRVIVGRGHSPEHAALYCGESGVLIAGDMLLPRISTNVSVWPWEPEADPLGDFLAALSRMAELPADTLVLPSHGLPFRGLRDRIAALHAHHAERLDRLLDACREPRSAAEALPFVFARDFDDHQLFFAMGETLAHLNYLMHRGRLVRRIGTDGVYRYAAPATQ